MENEFGYFAKDVAADLEITTSTLRRWAIALEKEGYSFDRNDKDRRIYYERDFAALRELKKLTGNNVPFADAIKAVTATDFDNKNAQKTPSVYGNEVRLSRHELESMIDEVARRTAEQTAEAMQHKLRDEIERRDRTVVQQLQEFQEQKEIAATTPEENRGRKKWWQFWK